MERDLGICEVCIAKADDLQGITACEAWRKKYLGEHNPNRFITTTDWLKGHMLRGCDRLFEHSVSMAKKS